ncbi:hypothetical protein [Massilia sp. S19_KUP03_FR1]
MNNKVAHYAPGVRCRLFRGAPAAFRLHGCAAQRAVAARGAAVQSPFVIP